MSITADMLKCLVLSQPIVHEAKILSSLSWRTKGTIVKIFTFKKLESTDFGNVYQNSCVI